MKKKKGGSTLPRKKKGFRLAFKSYWQLYVLVLPAVLYFLVFNYLPLYGIQIAFKDYKAVKGIAGKMCIRDSYYPQYVNTTGVTVVLRVNSGQSQANYTVWGNWSAN